MGIQREVQGKQRIRGIGYTVLILVCASVLILSGGCSRAAVTIETTPKPAAPSSNPQTVETLPKKDSSVTEGISAKTSTTAASGTASTTDTSVKTDSTVTADPSATVAAAAAPAPASPPPLTTASPATSAPAAPAPVLYESIAFGVRVSESSGWVIQKSFDTPSLKVVFGHEKVQAILSVLSPDKTGKAILGELLQGLGDVEVISRTDTTLEVRTRYADSMRTIAHVVREGRFNYLLVFVTPDNGLAQRLDAIASLISSLDYLG